MKKVHDSEEANVGAETSENEGSEVNHEKNSKLSHFYLKTGSIPEKN